MNWVKSSIQSLKTWTHDKDGEPVWHRWMLSAAIAVLAALLIIAMVQYLFVTCFGSTPDKDTLTRFGISGDFFGFANAVFSALAFAMLIVTLWMQKHELSLQREEIKNTQEELKGQKLEMQQQNASLRQQTFENTFFGMLQMHGEVVAAIKPSSDPQKGREAFQYLLSTFRNFGDPPKPKGVHGGNQPNAIPNVARYEKWYENYETHVGHYFRTLYNLVRYVDEHGGEQRESYARLIRAQLSSNELQLLLFNGLSEHGIEKFKPLIEKYTLLKHLKATAENKDAREQYGSIAFVKATDREAL